MGSGSSSSSNNASRASTRTAEQTAFLEAASRGDLAALQKLRAQHDVKDLPDFLDSTWDNWKMRALHLAADRGHIPAVKFLLAEGASLDVRTDRGNTPLHCALRGGFDTTGEVLLQHLLWGLQWPRMRLVLIGHRKGREDACPFALVPLDICKIIVKEVRTGSMSGMQVTRATNADGAAVIDLCARMDCTLSLQVLLRCGISPSESNPAYYGYTPLHHAATHNSVAVMKLLLEAGADVHGKNVRKETPLYRGCCATADPEDVIAYGADPEAGASGRTPLQEATARKHHATVQLLKAAIERRKSVAARNSNS